MTKLFVKGFILGAIFMGMIIIGWLYIALKPADIELDKLELVDLHDKPVNLAQYKGKNVFLNFWNTRCKPCLQEFATIESAKDSLAGENILFIMVSDDEITQIETFQQKHPHSFTFLKSSTNVRDYGVYALPTTYYIDKTGHIVMQETGARDWSTGTNYSNLKTLTEYYK